MINIYEYSIRISVATAFGILTTTSALAQTACVNNINPNSCTVASGTTLNNITTTGVGSVLTNNGTIINGAATANDNSNLVNSGTIGAITRTFGINSSIINSGTINGFVRTFSDDSSVINSGAMTNGILTTGNNATITSSGTVNGSVTTNGNDSTVTNSGIMTNDILTTGDNSSIANSGTVNGSVTTNGNGSAVMNSGSMTNGILTTGNNSSITNSATVSGLVSTTGNDSSVTNSGSITGGISITGNNPTLNVLPGSLITGAIDLSGGGTSTINIPSGINVNYTIASGQPTVVNTNGAPFLQSGNQIIIFDPSGFAPVSVFVSDLTSSITNIIDNNTGQTVLNFGSSLSGVSKNDYNTTDLASSRAWISGFGGFSRISGGQTSFDVSNTYTGIMVGYETGLSRHSQIGVFGGISQSEIKVSTNAQDTDVDSYFGGAYWKGDIGNHRLHLSFTAGTTDHSYTRSIFNNTVVGGVETANANYDGWFISPSATFLTPVNFAGTTSTASLRINYTGLFLDSGTETGSSTAIAFGDRDIHLMGARAQFTVPYYSTKDNGTENLLEWRSGIEGQFNLNSDDVSSSLGGSQITFASDTDDQLSGFAGVSFTRTSADGLRSIGADVELQTGILQNGMKVTGQIMASMKF